MEWSSDWWRRNVWTVAILVGAFASAFLIRTIWTYPVIAQWGPLYTYAGGSDSFYHSNVMRFIVENHRNLIKDSMLKFPFGAINPREPLFDWMNAILGIAFAPLFGGNAVVAGSWFLDLQGPLWAALSVFPVYLIGKEVSSRRTGLIAAMIFPFLPASIDSSIFGYANYLSFYTFLILVVVYSWIRTVKAVGTRRYVPTYRDPKQVYYGLRTFLRTERPAVKWAVFTGVSLGALALAWQGYTYGVVVIALSVLILLIAERIRKVDSFGLYVCAWVVGLVGFPMAIPYYLVQLQFNVWFSLPLLLYFGVLAILLPFVLLRDTPWVVSIPALVGLFVVAAVLLEVLSPSYFTSIVTGQGYFVKNLIYTTVAEAQAPSIDQLVVSYGVITFFLAFVGIVLFIYQLARGRFPRAIAVFLVFAILSVYLPISAAKFFLLGSPAFALLPAEALRRALDVAGYPELRRTVASLSDRRGQLSAFRRAFKLRHVLVFALVLGLLLPNIWISIDAGIPGNTKSQLSSQVGSSLPSWLQPNSGLTPSSAYFGAAGTSLDTPNQYDSAGYNWLALQDRATPAPDRPAFISWWDYGFQAIAQGDHPSVADNFQNGIDPAGQFLLAQNESNAIGVLATTLLQAEQQHSGDTYLPASLNQILSGDGVNVSTLHTLLANTSQDYRLVVANPARYLPVNPSTITDDNAMYLAVSYFLGSSLTLSGIARVYDDLQAYTGWTIRYDMVDSRLFPFSGQSTGIFYAPAALTGRVISGAGLPSSFFNVTVLTSTGATYPLGQVPAGVTPVQYNINYFPPFYQSFIYRTYIGYNGTNIGLGGGIPGLSSNLATSPVEPGWMLQHFQVVYRTAYYCPTKAADANGNCLATNLPQAVGEANATKGAVANTTSIRYFQGGEAMLEYYPGQTMLGDVRLADGSAVSGARVTVFDQWGIPHFTTLTAADGSFSALMPPGNDTVNITTGTLSGLQQQGSVLLRSLKVDVTPADGLSFNAPTLTSTVVLGSVEFRGTVYWNVANNSSYVPIKDPLVAGAQIVLWGPNGLRKVTTTTDADGTFDLTNVAPGVYNYSVLVGGHNYTQAAQYLTTGSAHNSSVGLPAGELSGSVLLGGATVAGATVVASNASATVGVGMSNRTGHYLIRGLGPGNYTLVASGPLSTDRSAGVTVEITSPGANVSTNLSLVPTATVQFSLLANGAPAPGIPVRFVPLPSYPNASRSPLAALQADSSNGTVVVADSGGIVTATLPVGNYSVYALGYVGSSLESALTSVAAFPGLPTGLVPLVLGISATLSGTVAQVGTPGNSTRSAVLVYGTGFAEATAWADRNGSYSLVLPLGNYTVLALQGPLTVPAGISAALTQVNLHYPVVLPLKPIGSITSRFAVGAVQPDGTLFPAVAATVSVSAGPNGPTIPALAGQDGSVGFFLPSSIPLSAGGYCVAAQSAGFLSVDECGLTPGGLASLTRLVLPLRLVDVRLTVLGLPSGTSVTVNMTAVGAPATTRSLSGGPVFTFTTTPGPYTISARAVIGQGTVVYLPSSILNTTIPLGAFSSDLTLVLVPGINASGALSLPPGGLLANATIALASPFFNITVNGTHFTHGFDVAPATYSAHSTITVAGVTYTNLSRVTVGTDGTITPAISLRVAGVTLEGTLTSATGGALRLSTTVTLTAGDGSSLLAPVTDGSFNTTLPANSTFRVSANATALTPGPNGSYFATFTTLPGAVCTTGKNTSTCSVRLQAAPNLTWLNGSLSAPGVPGTVPGTVRLTGPYPSTTVVVLTASNGSFSTQLLPGAYSVLAAGGGPTAPLGDLTTVFALPSTGPVVIDLRPTWAVTVTVGAPNGSAATLGSATIVIRNSAGSEAVYTGVSVGGSVALALPVGTYAVTDFAVGAPNGVATNASGTGDLVVASGNVALTVPLVYRFDYRVTGTLLGNPAATVNAGGEATYQFTIRNSGNAPVTVHPVGSPSYWRFNFSFTNATLTPGPAGNTVSGQVNIRVPLGTLVLHPPVLLELELANGTVVGTVSPSPAVQVNGYLGVAIGPISPPTVGFQHVLVPFFLVNTGNVYESVRLTIVDQLRIESLGWVVNIHVGNGTLAGPAGLTPGVNSTESVNLTARGPVFVPVGTVTLSAVVLNGSGSVSASTILHVPIVAVRPGGPTATGPFTVTGPGVASPPSTLPDWVVPLLAFVPAIALAVALLVRRWVKTRRWTRR